MAEEHSFYNSLDVKQQRTVKQTSFLYAFEYIELRNEQPSVSDKSDTDEHQRWLQ